MPTTCRLLAAVLCGLILALALPPASVRAAAPAPAATAPLPCASLAALKRQLDQGYGEAPVSFGVQANGSVLLVFTSPRSGTWTVVSAAPDGQACVLATGRGWRSKETAGHDASAMDQPPPTDRPGFLQSRNADRLLASAAYPRAPC